MTNETKLPACAARAISAMVYGVHRPWTVTPVNGITGETIPAGTPLNLREAALSSGMRHRTARNLSITPEWAEALRAERDSKAFAEDPESIHQLILTRDRDDHDSVMRLKAIEQIRGKPPQHSVTWDEFASVRKQAKEIGVSPGKIIEDPGIVNRPAVDPTAPAFKGKCTQARQRPQPRPEPAFVPRLGGRKVR